MGGLIFFRGDLIYDRRGVARGEEEEGLEKVTRGGDPDVAPPRKRKRRIIRAHHPSESWKVEWGGGTDASVK